MKTLKEQIEIMTAYLAGKQVESISYFHSALNYWQAYKSYNPDDELSFDWINRDYRVRKETEEIECYGAVFDNGCICTHSTLSHAENCANSGESKGRVVKLKGTYEA